MSRYRRYLPFVLIALIVMVVAYAFAAANTVPATNAGDGEKLISGYTVSLVHYGLLSTDPSKIDTVTFTLTPDNSGSLATSVQIQLVPTGSWYTCTAPSNSNIYTCAVSGGVTALAATNLRVVAAQ